MSVDPQSPPQVRWDTPGYLAERFPGQHTTEPTLQALREGTATQTLREGLPLRGRVTDAAGAPVAGARVLLGDSRFSGNPPPGTVTDAGGRWSFDALPAEPQTVTFRAEGFGPVMLDATPGAGPEVVAALPPAALFRVRVVDARGEPVAGARVRVIDAESYVRLAGDRIEHGGGAGTPRR